MIILYNDGKGKPNSYEARFDVSPEHELSSTVEHLYGFGADAQGAIANLRLRVAERIALLQALDYSEFRESR
ncbi:hypothetical protein [Hymenobacter cellulosivorans]|uniref:Uncharacterized protein n=1 Tax=Hymenobacter cellulosivorans TaxID=2932249 RepID=A0ABY4F9C5_9BACT|nr:hypothetical protein [Hymenobacter cellulosivorans]UOQ53029.1 hypothetical protein MUN80_25245 [Hymenobacter cellulosivorans]